MSRRVKSSNRRKLLILALIATTLMTFGTLIPQLLDRYRVEKDRQNLYWMARFQDPELFETDYLRGARLVEIDVLGDPVVLYPRSLGYGLLFYLVSFVIDHIWLGKLLVFFLMPICVLFLFKLGEKLDSPWTGLYLSLLFSFFVLASPRSISIATGVQRAFSVPLLIVFLYFLVAERYFSAGMMILASALFYAPMFPLTALTYGLALIRVSPSWKPSLDLKKRKSIPLIVGALLAFCTITLPLAVEFKWLQPEERADALTDPKESGLWSADFFQHSTGWAPLYSGSLLVGRAGILDSGVEAVNLLSLTLLGVLVYVTIGAKSLQRLPGICWRLLAASAIMYSVSLFTILGLDSLVLYFPSRYTRATLFLVPLYFVGLNWRDFLEKAPNRFQEKARTWVIMTALIILTIGVSYILISDPLLVLPIVLLVGMPLSALLVVLGVSSLYWWRSGHFLSATSVRTFSKQIARPIIAILITATVLFLATIYIRTLGAGSGTATINPSSTERHLLRFSESLPKNALLMGDPEIMTSIPLFAKRSVLFRALQPNLGAPILPFFDAYYAESPEAVLDFCRQYNIDYLIVNQGQFAPDYLAAGQFFHDPYNEIIARTVASRSNFILPQIPDDRKLFQSGELFVVPCDADVFK